MAGRRVEHAQLHDVEHAGGGRQVKCLLEPLMHRTTVGDHGLGAQVAGGGQRVQEVAQLCLGVGNEGFVVVAQLATGSARCRDGCHVDNPLHRRVVEAVEAILRQQALPAAIGGGVEVVLVGKGLQRRKVQQLDRFHIGHGQTEGQQELPAFAVCCGNIGVIAGHRLLSGGYVLWDQRLVGRDVVAGAGDLEPVFAVAVAIGLRPGAKEEIPLQGLAEFEGDGVDQVGAVGAKAEQGCDLFVVAQCDIDTVYASRCVMCLQNPLPVMVALTLAPHAGRYRNSISF